MEQSVFHPVSHLGPPSDKKQFSYRLINEEPLSIRVDGKPYVVVMRTPGEEIEQAAGLCLAEGLVDSPEDFASLAVCEEDNTNVVTVTLTPDRRAIIGDKLDRRGYISQTSCGICGKEVVADLYQKIDSLEDEVRLDVSKAVAYINGPDKKPDLWNLTHAAHMATLYSSNFDRLCVAEDVGRHNATDKAIGKLFMNDQLGKAKLLVLSSRISYELVQKAARARIPIIVGYSLPTSLAVSLAASLNMTLASLDGASGLFVYCVAQRLK